MGMGASNGFMTIDNGRPRQTSQVTGAGTVLNRGFKAALEPRGTCGTWGAIRNGAPRCGFQAPSAFQRQLAEPSAPPLHRRRTGAGDANYSRCGENRDRPKHQAAPAASTPREILLRRFPSAGSDPIDLQFEPAVGT